MSGITFPNAERPTGGLPVGGNGQSPIAWRAILSRSILWLLRTELVSWASLVFAIVSIYVTVVNVVPGTTVHFIDNLWPSDPRTYLYTLQFSWLPQRMGFYNALSLIALPFVGWAAVLQSLGVDPSGQEIITVCLLEFTTGFFGYKLIRRHILRGASASLSKILATGAALCLMNNYYVQSVIWWDFVPEGFVMTAFGLMFLYFAMEACEIYLVRGVLPKLTLVGMILASTIAFSVSIPFNLSILVLAVALPPLVWLNHIRDHPSKYRLLLFMGLTLAIILLTSFWWIYPSFMMTQLQPAYIGNAVTQSQSLQTFQTTTSYQTFTIVLSGLIGYPYSSVGHSASTTLISQTVGVALSFFLPVIIGFALLVRPNSASAVLPYSVAVALLLALFITGVNSPLYPAVFNVLFKSNVALTALRTPFVALGYGFSVLWISATSVSVSEIARWWTSYDAWANTDKPIPKSSRVKGMRSSRRFRKWSPHWTLLVGLVVVVAPTVASAPAAYLGDAVPTAPYVTHSQIPDYELEVAAFLKANLHDQYALLFPGGFLDQNGSGGYEGYDVLPSLIPDSLLIDNYRQGFVASDNSLLDTAYQDLFNAQTANSEFTALLAQLAVKYVVVEGNLTTSQLFGQAYAPNYPALLDQLNQTTGLSISAIIGPDYIYGLNGSADLVSLAESTIDGGALINGTYLQQVNLTRAFYNSTLLNLAGEPYHSFTPTLAGNSILFKVGEGARENLTRTVFPAPIGPSSPPIVFNGYPLGINTSIFPELVISFSTNAQTAISVSIVTLPSLTSASQFEIKANTFDVVSPYDNLGVGDASLAPAYGYNHFTSPDRVTTLVANLPSILGSSPNRTVEYALISLWPVINGGGVPQGTAPPDWPGTQELEIYDFGVGSNVYDPPKFAPQTTPLALAPQLQAVNLTETFSNGLFATSNDTPARHLFPVEKIPLVLSANQSVKSNWSYYEAGTPFPQGGPPTFLNAGPLELNISRLPFISLNVSTNLSTGFDLAVTTLSNLSSESPTQLSENLSYLGGTASNLGPGDPLLFEAYGGLHYVTNSTDEAVDDNLLETLQTNTTTDVNFVIPQLFYVNQSGEGVKNLPVQQWPGTQSLTILSLINSNYGLSALDPLANGSIVGLGSPISVTQLPALEPSTVIAPDTVQMPLNTGALSFDLNSPTSISVNIAFSSVDSAPFLIVLHENYASGWSLTSSTGVSNWSPVLVDGAMDGFLVYPSGSPAGAITFQLTFLPQAIFEIVLYGGLLIPFVMVAGIVMYAVLRRRPLSRCRQ